MESLFFYGTLVDPEIAELVIGRSLRALRAERATLHGYKAVLVVGKPYPGLKAAPDVSAGGVLVHGITPDEMEKLVRYEERAMYATETVTVETVRGPVRAKVFMPRRRVRLSATPWDLTSWQRRMKKVYLSVMRTGR